MTGTSIVGYVLSDSSTRTASMIVTREWERRIREGMMVIVEGGSGDEILAMVSNVRHYNEFFEPGDVWSEAIREGQLPPLDVARRYVIARLELLGVLSKSGLSVVDRPPEPGSPVYPASSDRLSSLVGGCALVEIGSLYGYEDGGARAYLNLANITMHMAVLGVTGSGKSNTIGVLIEELGRLDSLSLGGVRLKTLPVVVVDAHGDYIDYFQRPDLVPSYEEVIRVRIGGSKVRISAGPYRREAIATVDFNVYCDWAGSRERCNTGELAELIYTTERGRIEGLELQLALLDARLQEYVDEGGDLNKLFTNDFEFQRFIQRLEGGGAHQATARAVERTLRSFRQRLARYKLVGGDAPYVIRLNGSLVDEVSNPDKPRLVILDLSAEGSPGVDPRTKQFIVSFLSRLLFNRFVQYRSGGVNRLLAFVIEEAQNYAPNTRSYPIGYSVARDILAAIATQGRKFGLSLVLVSQRPSFIDPVVMSMVNTFIVHRVAPGDVQFVETVTGGLPQHIKSKLTNLETGVAVVTGQMNTLPYPILVRVRRRKSHVMGSVV